MAKNMPVFLRIKICLPTLGSWDIKAVQSDDEDMFKIEATKSEYGKCMRCWRHIEGIKKICAQDAQRH